ncbi:MAG: aminodeoxychorismate/anthranilate synthase component II [Hyphomonas sp.]|jgi:anthranilate synthase/aminodeoxychorismate synthase-like glutamine amidotransferase|uniref:anthranilate synthase component II n=2 Tax=Hyphomonas sp. TaxID=87 RepID=UPI00326340EB
MILVLNNRDSFVFNLARYLTCEGANVSVVDSDRISLDEIADLAPQALVLSPGPCTPNEAGICLEAVRHFAGKLPILGVCLGHQVIAQVFGGEIVRSAFPKHGRTTKLDVEGGALFEGLPPEFDVGLYNSLVATFDALPEQLRVDARSAEGEIMALSHISLPLFSVQFHPESILTEHGFDLIGNFVRLAQNWTAS